jgi:NADH-quinone oxidoreductase subunit E
MLRRLHPEQPDSFAFTPANQAWAEAQITKYPEGRQASAIIPLLWRAQEQEGWLTRPAIEHVCDMLGMPISGALRSRPSTSCSSSRPWARSRISRSAARHRA